MDVESEVTYGTSNDHFAHSLYLRVAYVSCVPSCTFVPSLKVLRAT